VRWLFSPRLAAVALGLCAAAIVALTTWPFDFDLQAAAIRAKWAAAEWVFFYRTEAGELIIDLDLIVNIALFFPYGFALGLSGRRRPLWREAVVALVAGLTLSVLVEGLQLLTPTRATQLADVWRNTLGAGLGGVAGTLLRAWIRAPG
jgi:VanZ family protein